jgi:hypothetical protein
VTVQQPAFFLADAAVSHDAEGFRRFSALLTEDGSGVYGSTDMAVTQRGAGANMSVDVAGGRAIIPGSEATYQGSYFVENRGTQNVTITASDPTNPRIDRIVARVRDDAYSGSSNDWDIIAVAGTPAGVPSAPSAPNNAISLATVAVAASATSITNANITSVRTYYRPKGYTSSVSSYVSTTSYVTTGASVALPPGYWMLYGKSEYADVGAGGVVSNPFLQLWNSTASSEIDVMELYYPIEGGSHRYGLNVLGTLSNVATTTIQLRAKEAQIGGAQRTFDKVKLAAVPVSLI